MVGRFPRGQLARLWMAIYLLAAVGGLGLGASSLRPEAVGPRERLRRVAPVLVGVAAILSFTRTPLPLLLTLGAFAVVVAMRFVGRRAPAALTRRLKFIYVAGIIGAYLIIRSGGGVGFNGWGGFLLTLGVATGGIVLSFPLGVALGLGRRSTFPVIRTFCVGYIEIIRGVPLITLLFIGSVTIGLFLPPGSPRPQLVTRGLVVIVLFTAAYLAETVRGGLQSVPGGQVEAAKAIGLSPLKTTYLIVLPQALRNVIPTLVGQFIALLKDTTLLSIIGLIELLGVGQALLAQSDFRGQGLQGEIFAFAGFLFWVCCYSMSKASQRLERRLGVGER
jgi:general L-amino acid transport system permease protein